MNQSTFNHAEGGAQTALFLEAFQQYRKAFEEQPGHKQPQVVEAPFIPLHETFFTPAQGWGDAAQAHLSFKLSNEVNCFGEGLRKLAAWKEVLEAFTGRKERVALYLEFVEPLATQLISFPYALKNRFIFAAMRLCDEANRILQQELHLEPTSNDTWMKKEEKAWPYIEPWDPQKDIKNHFKNIFPGGKKGESRVYKARRRLNHTIPLYIEEGVLSSVITQQYDERGYCFIRKEESPLTLEEIQTELLPLHQACCIAHTKMKTLVERQQQEIFQRFGISEKNV